MPLEMGKITSHDFSLQNVTSPDQIAKLDQALAYMQQSPAAAAVIFESAMTGVAIGFNPNGANGFPSPNNGADGHSVGSNLILWNPDAAIQMYDNADNPTGVSSAASGLVHEMVHSIDPMEIAHSLELIPGYENLAEYTAVTIEAVFNTELHEPTRDNHDGISVIVENPTTHTNTQTGNWEQAGVNGQTEVGPRYEFGQRGGESAPEFGSDTGPGSSGGSNGSGSEGGDDPNGGGFDDPNHGGGSGSNGGCVSTASILPDGRTAGDVRVGESMVLGDPDTMESSLGRVTFSTMKEVPGFRITTETGASLVCSDTAPIPAQGRGLLTPQQLLGERVAVRWDENGESTANWEKVVKVDAIGLIKVQHITVGDRCFWAGEKPGAYILHHNLKDAGGGGGTEYPWDDPFWGDAHAPVPTHPWLV
jgi:hypothetical protein